MQIRAQFAAVGAPLLGDTLYGPLAAAGAAPDGGDSGKQAAQPLQGGERLLREPLAAGIGLQACRLTFSDNGELMRSRTCFEAPAPWWRC